MTIYFSINLVSKNLTIEILLPNTRIILMFQRFSRTSYLKETKLI